MPVTFSQCVQILTILTYMRLCQQKKVKCIASSYFIDLQNLIERPFLVALKTKKEQLSLVHTSVTIVYVLARSVKTLSESEMVMESTIISVAIAKIR